ncbi:hypothetical protein SLE2022_389120 [Rubroshorea leprosula]
MLLSLSFQTKASPPNPTIYPYEGINGSCNSAKESNHAAWITGYEDVPSNSEAALLKAVAQQPVSVAIDAGESDFQHYSSGVFTGQCGTELDHGVTAIGYGTPSDGTKYWLVKNSWGTSWGMEGYITMERDIDAPEGLCGIAMEASYPTALRSQDAYIILLLLATYTWFSFVYHDTMKLK